MTISIIYTLITRNKKIVLCEYTEFSGNFQQISLYLLSQLPSDKDNVSEEISEKIVLDYDSYDFFILEECPFYFICLAKKPENDNQKYLHTQFIFEYLEILKDQLFTRKNFNTQITKDIVTINSNEEKLDQIENLKNAPAFSMKFFIPVIKVQLALLIKKFNQTSRRKNSENSETNSKLLYSEIKSNHKMSMIVKAPTINSESEESLLVNPNRKKKFIKKCIIFCFLFLIMIALLLTIIYFIVKI